MAHLYETGGMRRVHLKGRENILKRLLVHAGGFNLALLLRQLFGVGKPRRTQGASGPLLAHLVSLLICLREVVTGFRFRIIKQGITVTLQRPAALFHQPYFSLRSSLLFAEKTTSTTGS